MVGRRRSHFWRLVACGARRGLAGFSQAVTLAILGEHLIRYTQEVVLPRLDRSLALLEADTAAEVPRRRASASRRASRRSLLANESRPS
jgi:Domain of unknown function (DUF4070)